MSVLPLPNDDRLSPISNVPGLYISSRVAASSPSKLSSEGITHIVSVLKDNELSFRQNTSDDWHQFKLKQVAIDDNGDEDILVYLDDVYQWVERALNPPKTTDEENALKKESEPQVLIHCRQGISRSGAFIVGYLMKKCSLSYSQALQLARSSRDAIQPNDGFERQLRIWEHCRYDIYLPEPSTSTEPLSSPGPDKVERQLAAEDDALQPSTRNPKAAYKVWKRERDNRLSDGDDRSRATSMASMAAEFGKRRLEAQERRKAKATAAATAASAPVPTASDDPKRQSDTHLPVSRSQAKRDQDNACPDPANSGSKPTDTGNEDEKTEAQWRRVEEMEKLWNDKLIRGEVERAKETGGLEDLMKEVFGSIKNTPQ